MEKLPLASRLACAIGFAAVLVVSADPAARAQTAQYTVTDLGLYTPNEINESRQVSLSALLYSGSGGRYLAGIWENGTVRELPVPAGYSWAVANGLNDAAQAVGAARIPFGPPDYTYPDRDHAYLWQPDGTPVNLGVLPGAYWSFATAINTAGQIVGSSGTGTPFRSGWSQAVIWQHGTMTAVAPAQPQGGGEATAINQAGDVVGFATPPSGWLPPGVYVPYRAFLWRAGTLIDLGTLPGGEASPTSATDINDLGQVVGQSMTAGDIGSGFLWQNGAMVPLAPPAGFRDSAASAINNAGQAVGLAGQVSCDAIPWPCSHAIVWQNGVGVDLNTLLPPNSGWVLVSAEDINDRGQIIGTGTFNGERRYFLLDPFVPLPARPTSFEQCRNGGWQTFRSPAFRNQGDCISEVARSRRH